MATPRSRTPCRNYERTGTCRFGDRCHFQHGSNPGTRASSDPHGSSGSTQVCRFFLEGRCRFGASCRFAHPEGAVPSATTGGSGAGSGDASLSARGTRAAQAAATTASGEGDGKDGKEEQEEEVCGVCFEPASHSNRAALMSGCDHPFCVKCLSAWRTEGTGDQTRACPVCRKHSHFYVAAPRFMSGEAKKVYIEEYKRRCSARACKNHKPATGTGCRFGHRCFYAHWNEAGQDVKPEQKRKWESDRKAAASARPRGVCPYHGSGAVADGLLGLPVDEAAILLMHAALGYYDGDFFDDGGDFYDDDDSSWYDSDGAGETY